MIRPAEEKDAAALSQLRCALWPESSAEEHAQELAEYFAGQSREPLAILVAEHPARGLQGFCELSIRLCAEGCVTDHVGYLEGWYVVPEARRQGVGGALVRAAEEWARSQGCTELASDTQHDNSLSTAAHKAVGFEDVGLIRCFCKKL